jgi:hypothetical protein
VIEESEIYTEKHIKAVIAELKYWKHQTDIEGNIFAYAAYNHAINLLQYGTSGHFIWE